MGKSLATSLPNLTMAAFSKPKNVARVRRQDIPMGKPCCLQWSFCGWSRFTFNEMRGGPQGQPPGVPSILGTSKTLQKGKRHNKACLPRREKWNLSGPHHPYHCGEPKPLLIVLRWQKHHFGAKKGFAIWYNPALQRSRNSTNHQKHDERYTCHSLHCFWSSQGISGHHPQCTSVDSSKSTASGFGISTRFPSRYPYHSTKEHSIKKLIFTIWSPVWAKSLLQLCSTLHQHGKRTPEINIGWYHLFINTNHCTIAPMQLGCPWNRNAEASSVALESSSSSAAVRPCELPGELWSVAALLFLGFFTVYIKIWSNLGGNHDK